MYSLLENNEDISRLCRTHRVARLYVFGSAVKGIFGPESDIDLVVSFDNVGIDEYADNYFDLKFALQELLRHPVDLLEEQAIRNPFFREEINTSRQIVYG